MTADESLAESFLHRPPPSGPYQLPGMVLRLPRTAWERTLELFQLTADRCVEAACFWYGVREENAGVCIVQAVVVPRQHNAWGNYLVSAAAMADVAAATRPLGLKNLAQVHTHPGQAVEHSRYDDAQANSRKALSLVVPFYGRWQGLWPEGLGVHEFQNGYWHLLTEGDAARRVVLVDDPVNVTVVDLR